MRDLIDRQEAMYAHCMIVCEKEPDACAIDCPDEAIFRQLQSAQPERKKGKWIYQNGLGWGETWICSECGEKTTSTVMGKPRYNWCPICGADMRGEQDA